jgi:hypothetical protein
MGTLYPRSADTRPRMRFINVNRLSKSLRSTCCMFNDENDSAAASSEWEENERNMGWSPLNEYVRLPEYFRADASVTVKTVLNIDYHFCSKPGRFRHTFWIVRVQFHSTIQLRHREFCLLKCNDEQSVDSQLTFRRNMSPPFSGPNKKPSMKQVSSRAPLSGFISPV